jgi:uncharacterized protein (TIGR02246 family)
MHSLGRLAAVATLFVAIGSSGSALAADKVRQAIDKVNQAWLAAYIAHDSAKIAALYAPDASVFPPSMERANGRDAIRKVWQGFMDAGATNVSLHTVDVDAHGSIAIETGDVALDMPGKDGKLAHVTAKYVVAWKRGKGGWQLYRDIWNDNPPR